ncbi:MAG TPA: ethanolamine ammonia-lyase subunit EutC [Terriglobales bacterium]|jgi:ethanolamine ammonia-lyase small subunit|nr:ethanolamine ammonia-lyase subunit EutC [Terriglobales bacterium]
MAGERDSRADGRDEHGDNLAQFSDLSEIAEKVRVRTPARLLAGRSGAAYRTNTQLELRQAHAAARDAVRAELGLFTNPDNEFIRKWNLFEVCSRAANKDEYLLRPDLGRQLNEASRAEVNRRCIKGRDLQIVIGDGLSVTAVAMQVPRLLQQLYDGAITRGWSVGNTFVIRYCRVGILNEIGELLSPKVAVLLIGERPGLATAESLSAYMAYQPKASDTDANRNLISNIHARGVSTEQAVQRILNLARSMTNARQSGFQLREELPQEIPPALRQS